MDLLNADVQAYAEQYCAQESELLARLNRETYTDVHCPQMLSGHLQGRILAMLSSLRSPATILEIGTYTGYSALCLAEGLAPGGILHTIDPDKKVTAIAQRYIQEAGKESSIKIHNGEALDIIQELPGSFDLVFIDADKRNYSNYFDAVVDRVTPNGLIIADNVLWSGRVLDPGDDKQSLALHAYNEKVAADQRVEVVLLPVRDGLMLARKK